MSETSATQPKTSNQAGAVHDAQPPPPTRGSGKRVALIAVVTALIAGLLWFAYWYWTRNQVSTDDAYVQADIAQIAPRVTGVVAKVFVRDNQRVNRGDPLFTLDPADYKAALAKAEASLEAARASFGASQNSSSDIRSARAGLDNARAEYHRASADADRYQALFDKHEVSRQQLDQATTAAASARAKLSQARAKYAQAKASPDQIALKKSESSSANAKIAQAKAEVEQARLNLSYTKVRAPHAGKVAKKSIVAGSHISAGQGAMAVVENDPWVVANFKETALHRLRRGQPVSIEIDAYPNHEFSGRVESIQAGTGVTFSLLPPENATGNFVKIVQRVPVKIVFDQPDQLKGLNVSPGLSAVPTVNLIGKIKPLNRADSPATRTAGQKNADDAS